MITVDNLCVTFGAVSLLEHVSFVVNARDRIALTGKNGAGKTTLLRILCGMQQPSSGRVSVSSGTIVGYLPQVMKLSDDTTVREEALKAFADIAKIEERVHALEAEIASRTDYTSEEYMSLVERYTAEHERYLISGADSRDAALERTLLGLGFVRRDFERPTREFSGGWRMRIELAKLLLGKPDVLLLDEPTNHLDIESIQWLEQFLVSSAGAVMVVSHDRAFINNVTTRTMEISCRRVTDYRVKYDEYVTLRRERREQQLRAYENQQREISEAREFINRFRYKPSKAVQVQQKIKQLAKITPIEIDAVDTASLHLKFPPCLRSGDYPVIVRDAEKVWGATYDNAGREISPANRVFSEVSLTIKRGEKVAFVGKNGEGKTTMVKCIMASYSSAAPDGTCPDFYKGTIKTGYNVEIGYFAQNQAQLLDEDLTVFQTVDNAARGEIRFKINDILGAFMFGGEASEKKVKVLSGGERSRLAMIKLLLEPVNLLILDEPTNHLDMQSKDVLKEAIRAFDGTAIIVSHDREFLDGLVERVYEFGGGKVREFTGGIYDFLRSRNVSDFRQLEQSKTVDVSSPHTSEKTVSKPCSGNAGYAVRKETQRHITRLERRIKESEAKIEHWQARIDELDKLLCVEANAANIDLVTEYTDIKKNIEEEENAWTALVEELEAETKKLD
ncbi:MAG: ATP-binding cassette domain-containing protein [Prevotella sp.]|nr:ATP-binding cassette domain-containing protein [Prevotella sp.]